MSGGRTYGDPVSVLVAAAIAWGVLLLALAGTLPIVTPQSPPGTASATVTASGTVATTGPTTATSTSEQRRVTLVDDSGYRILWLVALPAVIALIVGVLLRRRPGVAAWVLSGAVLLAGVVGFVTILIGIAIVPIGVLLLVACELAALSGAARSGSTPGRRTIPPGVGA